MQTHRRRTARALSIADGQAAVNEFRAYLPGVAEFPEITELFRETPGLKPRCEGRDGGVFSGVLEQIERVQRHAGAALAEEHDGGFAGETAGAAKSGEGEGGCADDEVEDCGGFCGE